MQPILPKRDWYAHNKSLANVSKDKLSILTVEFFGIKPSAFSSSAVEYNLGCSFLKSTINKQTLSYLYSCPKE